jgi:uncharacterized protein (TIGR02466 family)
MQRYGHINQKTGIPYDLNAIGAAPVYISEMDPTKWDDIKEEMESMYTKYIEDGVFKQNPKWNTHELSDVTFQSNFLIDENCDNTVKEIMRHVQTYVDAVNPEIPISLKIENSWMTNTKKNQYTSVHAHGAALIAGVFYLDADPDTGNFVLPNTNLPLSTHSFWYHWGMDMETHPKAGKLMLFPGFMMHHVRTNITDKRRVSISFNLVEE